MKQPKPHAIKSTIRFGAKLCRPTANEKNRSWTLLTLPKNASAKLPSRDIAMVEGIINAYPFRAALEPDGNGSHRLRVSNAMRDAAGASVLDNVAVEITRTGDDPETRVPIDLRKALAAEPSAQALWAAITPTTRREWILWITTAKQPETRKHRIERACDSLTAGKRRVCCFGGLNWLTKDHATVESWRQLPTPTNRSSRKSMK
jgi:hypothetical protein